MTGERDPSAISWAAAVDEWRRTGRPAPPLSATESAERGSGVAPDGEDAPRWLVVVVGLALIGCGSALLCGLGVVIIDWVTG